ncbi:hypothetical protein Cadr_000021164 [Camelus dromedarius]|uniref:KIAA1755 n=1 Tax=Camelus dromedarius TaxID=9838 RepID=A0A5N4CU59_CAMDR|nr:hypothetical protein Cadr_000021164 [Camelus dromedarius]
MDPPSLDTAIQHALAGLYPPFEATAPTILGQVFRLLDSDFRGDGLSFLLDFLIPAKRLCEQVREAACAPYSHRVFLHEGWPLCLRNEVVVHLAPLNPLLLRQGDFYLQVEPQEEQSVCIMIKCLSVDLRTVDTKPVPVASYPVLFTQAWLEAINGDFEGSPLHNCLVASGDGIAPVPWTKITSPEFVDDRPQAVNVLSSAWRSLQLEALDLSSPQELHQARSPGSQVLLTQSLAKGKGRTYGNKYPGLIKVEQTGPGEVAFRMDDVTSQDLEGDYVALLDFSQESRGVSPRKEMETSNGSGTTQTKTSGPDADSDPLTEQKDGFPEALAGPPEKGPTLTEDPPGPEPRIGTLSVEIFRSRIACLPGGRDRAGRPLLLVSTTKGPWEAPWCTASEVTKLFSYLCTVPRPEDKTKGLAVVIDARKQPPHPGLVSALQATQALVPASIRAMLFLGEKEAALQLEALPDIQVEVLTSLKALSHHVDPSQLPTALEGPFPYCHGEWVQFFQKLDPFLADLRQASSLLKASIKEFEKCDPPGGVQEASRCLSKSKELMEAVLRDPGLLGLQREGGATLARLRQEGSRLDFNPDVRSHLAEAAALYSLVDEQLHVLVTASNHLLRRLELRVRLGRLEAAIHQVGNWIEQEGNRCLQVLTPKDGSLETVEKAHAEFEDFFLQAAAQYRHGLELSKEAAQLGAAARGSGEAGGMELPELVAFSFTQRAFQAKLTHFYMAAERQRTDLETLLHLHHFCKKVTWFHMDCQDLMAQLRLGKAQKASPGDQRRLHRYLQRLASEFPAEKLTAVGLQVASLSQEGVGRDLWEEARVRHEEIQTLLKKALAHCPCPAGPTAHLACLELRGVAIKGQGLEGEVTCKGRRDLPLQNSPGLDHSPKSCWPPWAPRRGQNRNFRADPPPQEAGQAVEAGEGKSIPRPLDSAPERFLATLFSWQRLPRQSQIPRPPGGSFSSEGTDSQTSLEDSPQTSPPASL